MPAFDSILAVILAGFALSATPGPSMLYVLSRSVGQSRMAGLASAIGLGLGGVFLTIATAFGLATFLERTEWAVELLKILGALYLIYLGGEMIWQARQCAQSQLHAYKVPIQSLSSIIWQGVLVELLNPKTVLFLALFLPQFVYVDAGELSPSNTTLQFLILGILVPLTAVPSDLIVAFVGGSLAQTVNNNPLMRQILSWVAGSILVLIAINLHYQLI